MARKKGKKTKIRYSEAPSGFAVFYNYKEPLMVFEEGYGYLGAIIEDAKSGKIQCHLCGMWMHAIGQNHIRTKHGINAAEYKDIVGLLPSTALFSEKSREKMVIAKLGNKRSLANLRPGKKMKKETKEKIRATLKKIRAEQQNLRGTCPEQLLDRLNRLAKEIGRTPTIDECTFHHTVVRVFGSWKAAIIRAGLSPRNIGENVMRRNNSFTMKPQEMIDMLREFKKTNGREASHSDLRRALLPSEETYKKHFGSFSKAKGIAYGR